MNKNQQLVLEVTELSKRIEKPNNVYVIGWIPEKKLKNAKDKMGVLPDEEVLILVDETVFGSAKDGTLFASWGIRHRYVHNKWNISWEELRGSEFSFETKGVLSKSVLWSIISGTGHRSCKEITCPSTDEFVISVLELAKKIFVDADTGSTEQASKVDIPDSENSAAVPPQPEQEIVSPPPVTPPSPPPKQEIVSPPPVTPSPAAAAPSPPPKRKSAPVREPNFSEVVRSMAKNISGFKYDMSKIKNMALVRNTYSIPSDETIFSYRICGLFSSLFATLEKGGVVVTNKGIYRYLASGKFESDHTLVKIRYTDMASYFPIFYNSVPTLENLKVSYWFWPKALIDNDPNISLVRFLENVRAYYVVNNEECEKKHCALCDGILDKAEKTVRANKGLDGDLFRMLEQVKKYSIPIYLVDLLSDEPSDEFWPMKYPAYELRAAIVFFDHYYLSGSYDTAFGLLDTLNPVHISEFEKNMDFRIQSSLKTIGELKPEKIDFIQFSLLKKIYHNGKYTGAVSALFYNHYYPKCSALVKSGDFFNAKSQLCELLKYSKALDESQRETMRKLETECCSAINSVMYSYFSKIKQNEGAELLNDANIMKYTDQFGLTIAHYAIILGDYELLTELKTADIPVAGYSLLAVAASGCYEENVFGHLLSLYDEEIKRKVSSMHLSNGLKLAGGLAMSLMSGAAGAAARTASQNARKMKRMEGRSEYSESQKELIHEERERLEGISEQFRANSDDYRNMGEEFKIKGELGDILYEDPELTKRVKNLEDRKKRIMSISSNDNYEDRRILSEDLDEIDSQIASLYENWEDYPYILRKKDFYSQKFIENIRQDDYASVIISRIFNEEGLIEKLLSALSKDAVLVESQENFFFIPKDLEGAPGLSQ